MASFGRERLILHGAIVLFVGLLMGFPAVAGVGESGFDGWRDAHHGLLLTGLWILVMATVLPALVLERRETVGLVVSLLSTGYGFMVAMILEAFTGARAVEPAGSLPALIAFAGNTVGITGALLATLLTISGAGAAMSKKRSE